LVFITETECVYCAVRAESLNTTQFIFVFTGLKQYTSHDMIRCEFCQSCLSTRNWTRYSACVKSSYILRYSQLGVYCGVGSGEEWLELRAV